MPCEPSRKRAIAFFDAQNLFHCAKEAFGYTFPNFDPCALAAAVCSLHGWQMSGVRVYTGVPDASDNVFWNYFWTAKGAQMGRAGAHVFTRPLRYRNKSIKLPDGSTHTMLVGSEKGIDVRLALDMVRLTQQRELDVVLAFSQDQDLYEVAEDVRLIAKQQNRWVKMASAFPFSPAVRNCRGINKTDWIRIDRQTYDGCIDKRDYRPKPVSQAGCSTP